MEDFATHEVWLSQEFVVLVQCLCKSLIATRPGLVGKWMWVGLDSVRENELLAVVNVKVDAQNKAVLGNSACQSTAMHHRCVREVVAA